MERAILDDQGMVNDALGAVGLGPVHMLGPNGAVILGLVYGYFPLMVLPIFAALGDLDRLADRGRQGLVRLAGQTFWHVTWPASLPGSWAA